MTNRSSLSRLLTSICHLSSVIFHLSFWPTNPCQLPKEDSVDLRVLRGEKECRPCHARLREDQVDLAPVFLRRCALACPVGRVVELVGNLRRPVAPRVAVKQI